MAQNKIVSSISILVNKCLALDPQKTDLLAKIESLALAITIQDLGLSFAFLSQDGVLKLLTETTNCENHIHGTSGALIAMCLHPNPQSFIQSGQVGFAGDIRALQAYSNFFKALRPDLIFMLTQGRNSTLASLLDKPLYAIQSWYKISQHKFTIELREYIQFEKQALPCQEEMMDFFDDIQTLKQDVDRVNLKLEHYLATAKDFHV